MKTSFHGCTHLFIAVCIIMTLPLNSCRTKKQASDTLAIKNNTKSAQSFAVLTKDSMSRMMEADMELEDVVVRFEGTPLNALPEGLVATPPTSELQLAPGQQTGIVLTAARIKFSQKGKQDGTRSSSIAYSDTSITDTRTAVSATEQSSSTGVYEPPTQGTVLAIVIAGLVILFVFLYRYYTHPKPQ